MHTVKEADINCVRLTLLLFFIPIGRHVKKREMFANSKTFAFQRVVASWMYSVIHNVVYISSFRRILEVMYVCFF